MMGCPVGILSDSEILKRRFLVAEDCGPSSSSSTTGIQARVDSSSLGVLPRMENATQRAVCRSPAGGLPSLVGEDDRASRAARRNAGLEA